MAIVSDTESATAWEAIAPKSNAATAVIVL
jgi:hypothetical protein